MLTMEQFLEMFRISSIEPISFYWDQGKMMIEILIASIAIYPIVGSLLPWIFGILHRWLSSTISTNHSGTLPGEMSSNVPPGTLLSQVSTDPTGTPLGRMSIETPDDDLQNGGKEREKNTVLTLPPGPPALPVLGNLLQLNNSEPHRRLQQLADKYGDIMYLKLGSFPAVVVSSADKARLFLRTHDASFASRFRPMAAQIIFGKNDMLMAPYGHHWRQLRKFCITQFLGPRNLESQRPLLQEEVVDMMKWLWEQSSHGTRAVNVSATCKELLSRIILRASTGRNTVQMADGSPADFIRIVSDATQRLGAFNASDFVPWLGMFDFQGIHRKCLQLKREIDEILDKVLQDHQEAKAMNKSHNDGDAHVLDTLLQLPDQDTAKAVIKNLYGAGTDTTASALEWAMSEIVRNPGVMEKLRQEMETMHVFDAESLQKMKYLNCVIKETLRLHPPAPLGVPHESLEDVTIQELSFHIPKRSRIIFNLWAIGRDPRVWENALQFMPDRFMAEEHENAADLLSEFRMIPFGGGRRICPGMASALQLLRVALGALVFHFDWRVEPGSDAAQLDMTEVYGITMNRKHNLILIPTLRKEPNLSWLVNSTN